MKEIGEKLQKGMEENEFHKEEPHREAPLLFWEDFLYEEYDFTQACEKLFPVNPPAPDRCQDLQKQLQQMQVNQLEMDDNHRIVITDHGCFAGSLPLVTVVDGAGKEAVLRDFNYRSLVVMPLEIRMQEMPEAEQIMTLLCFYLLYPLRVGRQKRRDTVTMLLDVLIQHSGMLPAA